MIKADCGHVVINGSKISVLADIACIIYSYNIHHDKSDGEDLREIFDLAMEANEEEFTDRLQDWIDKHGQGLAKVKKISDMLDQLLKELEDDVEDDEEDQQ